MSSLQATGVVPESPRPSPAAVVAPRGKAVVRSPMSGKRVAAGWPRWMTTFVLFGSLAGLSCCVGCSPWVRKPRLHSPGPAPIQQYEATQFDPYPPNDLAPEIVGGRPKDYAKPIDEVRRARQHNPRIPATKPGLLEPHNPTRVPLY
jgi:hypothetical protein